MRAAGAEPAIPYPGMNAKWPCTCLTCGREVGPRLYTVLNGHSACRYCKGQKIHSDDAVAMMQSAGFEPREPYPGANTPWSCICATCGRPSTPRYSEVRNGWVVRTAVVGGLILRARLRRCGRRALSQSTCTPAQTRRGGAAVSAAVPRRRPDIREFCEAKVGAWHADERRALHGGGRTVKRW